MLDKVRRYVNAKYLAKKIAASIDSNTGSHYIVSGEVSAEKYNTLFAAYLEQEARLASAEKRWNSCISELCQRQREVAKLNRQVFKLTNKVKRMKGMMKDAGLDKEPFQKETA